MVRTDRLRFRTAAVALGLALFVLPVAVGTAVDAAVPADTISVGWVRWLLFVTATLHVCAQGVALVIVGHVRRRPLIWLLPYVPLFLASGLMSPVSEFEIWTVVALVVALGTLGICGTVLTVTGSARPARFR